MIDNAEDANVLLSVNLFVFFLSRPPQLPRVPDHWFVAAQLLSLSFFFPPPFQLSPRQSSPSPSSSLALTDSSAQKTTHLYGSTSSIVPRTTTLGFWKKVLKNLGAGVEHKW
ncbi:hypothetical protein M0R45_005568 [Rubus argutus]|uniref:Uncharacterized protein n=1 Tax=Rubus argutus TaxID=59490 RepID=A0AAW1YNI9_RUBAR